MKSKIKTYTSDDIDVTYDIPRCIHFAACTRGLPAVFDTDKRPWIQPDQADADAIASVVEACPTGALQYTRKDGGTAETPDRVTQIRIAPDGPLFVRGDASIVNAAGEVLLNDARMALCRCGASQNKPLCDNSHLDAGFKAAGTFDGQDDVDATQPSDSALSLTPAQNGPLLLAGDFVLLSADKTPLFRGRKAALCRCGSSANKPFCDGTHSEIDFTTDEA
jgi:CDGSH-type Zn-finger protein/uncharacterized Fe-S cluster protein YjdI